MLILYGSSKNTKKIIIINRYMFKYGNSFKKIKNYVDRKLLKLINNINIYLNAK